jgi:hypothetical protein
LGGSTAKAGADIVNTNAPITTAAAIRIAPFFTIIPFRSFLPLGVSLPPSGAPSLLPRTFPTGRKSQNPGKQFPYLIAISSPFLTQNAVYRRSDWISGVLFCPRITRPAPADWVIWLKLSNFTNEDRDRVRAPEVFPRFDCFTHRGLFKNVLL